MPIDRQSVKKILVIRNDRFGEFLLNLPALRALKKTFVNASLLVVVDPVVKEIAESSPFIDEIIEWGHDRHSFLGKIELIGLLRKKKIDIAIILNPSKEFNLITWLCAIPVRVGYDRKWGFFLTHKLQDKKYLGTKHEVEYNLDLVNLVGANTDDKSLSIIIKDDAVINLLKEFEIERPAKLVALHPWTSDPIKQWPIDNFRELAKWLINEPDIKLIIIGGVEELKRNIRSFDDMGSDLLNLTGKTTLRESAALLKRCRLLISGDSGPVHLACAVGTPVLAIFRNDIPAKGPKRWGPWGEGHSVIEKERLSDITPEEVFNKAREIINK